MKLILLPLCLIIFIFSSNVVIAQNANSLEQMKRDVSALAHDSMMGRETGTKGEEMAANYIAIRMNEIGLRPMGDNNTFYQKFTKKTRYNSHTHKMEGINVSGKNVIGFLDNDKEYTIVIGAHYDHLGLGVEGSLHDKVGVIHNGADDNASGVAILLDLVKNLKETDQNFLFIAFSGEEKGLWGSNYFVKNATIDLDKVSMMINMDMVGMLDSNKRLAVHGVGTSPSFVEVVNGVKGHDFKIKMDSSGTGPSDHTSFYNDSIPVLHFFTGQHKHYHKPSDDIENLNYNGMVEVRNFILKILIKLDNNKLEFIKTKDRLTKSKDFKVTLGVMPDYLYDGEGLKIDGVKEGRPADKAGIIQGDIIVELNGEKIESMHDYMDAISKDLKGKKVVAVVLRGEQRLRMEISF